MSAVDGGAGEAFVDAVVRAGAVDTGLGDDVLAIYFEGMVERGVDVNRGRLLADIESVLRINWPQVVLHAATAERRVRGSEAGQGGVLGGATVGSAADAGVGTVPEPVDAGIQAEPRYTRAEWEALGRQEERLGAAFDRGEL